MGQIAKSFNASFTSDGAAKTYRMAYLPRMVSFFNKTQWDEASANPGVVKRAWGFSTETNGTAYCVKNTDGAATDSSVSISSGGFDFLTKDTYQFGPAKTGTAVSKAALAVVTIVGHGYKTGDTVWLTATTDMYQIAGAPYRVTYLTDDTFSIPVVSSGFANAATAVTAKQLLYPDLYVPFGCVITNMTAANPAVITTSVEHKFKVGNQVQLRGFERWGMVEAELQTAFITAVGTTSITLDLDSSGYTAFAYPTSAVAAAGINFPMVEPIGDKNFGFVGPTIPSPLGVQGAWAANGTYAVTIGIGDGTTVMHANNDECEVYFEFPDQLDD